MISWERFKREPWAAPVLAVGIIVGGTVLVIVVMMQMRHLLPAPVPTAPPCWGIVRAGPSTGWNTVHSLPNSGHLMMCTELELPDRHPGDQAMRTRTVCTRMDRIDQSHCARDFERIP